MVDAIGREPTLSDYTRNDLRRYQKILELRDEDVAPIEVKVIESGEALKTQPVSAWHFPFLPPQVQPQHRVEIPSQPESSSSHQVTTSKTHTVIAICSFFVGALFVFGALYALSTSSGLLFFIKLIFSIAFILFGIIMWKR
ncbi:hypothetical protein [Nostoc sp.]|uniref:hypothetical protein n=1 Tax=Nostoc sp. TaxID=1180 RepID=UPI002FFACF7E